MDKRIAIAAAGGTQRHLADLLGISHQAVSRWQQVPDLRVYQLRKLRPGWFRKGGRIERLSTNTNK